MKMPLYFLSVFWHKYIAVLRKTSKKKAQSVKPKANDTDPQDIHITSSSSDDDFKSPPKKKKTLQQKQENKNLWAKHYTGKCLILTLCLLF